MLREMLSNLIDNAIRYTPAGGRITVRVRTDDDDLDLVHLEVEDTGLGIPAAERERVVERFYRILGRDGDGSGLGLAIVKRIVEDHQGQLDIADRPGRTGAVVAMRFAIDANRRLLRPGSMSGQDMPDSEQVS
jgi:two-component system sensor histidine kinase TctE